MKFATAQIGALALAACAATASPLEGKVLQIGDSCAKNPGIAPCSELSGPESVTHIGESYEVKFTSSIPDNYDEIRDLVVEYKITIGDMSVNGTYTFEEWLETGFEQEGSWFTDKAGSFGIDAEILFKDYPYKYEGNETVVDVLQTYSVSTVVIPAWFSIIPLLVTVGMAILSRNVFLSLFTGIFSAGLVAGNDFSGALFGTIEKYILGSFADEGNAYVIFFSVFLGGCVALITKSGGARGMAESISKYASTPMLGQLATYVAGILVFFDDYSNALVVGNSMRPVTDILGVSREKLAFIVDATSAPIASIIPVSSWIAYEVGLINDMLAELTDEERTGLGFSESTNGLSVFLSSIPYRFYPIVMLVFQVFLIVTGLEFGPMLQYERRARYKAVGENGEALNESEEEEEDNMEEGLEDKDLEPEEDTPLFWVNGAIPIIVLVFFMCYYIIYFGAGGCGEESCDEFGLNCEVVTCTVANYIENTDSYAALLYGGFVSFLFIACFYRVQYKADGKLVVPFSSDSKPLMTIPAAVETFVKGITGLTPAVIVLLLAWSTGDAMENIGAPRYFYAAVNGSVAPGSIPALVFVMSSLIALATGTSWGTMAIMFPLIGPIIAVTNAEIYYSAVGSVLAGSVFGDHCSPISDTTVLSSLACKCNLLNHVGSQAPYAFFVAFFSTIFGDFLASAAGAGAGGGIVLSLLTTLGCALLVAAPVNSETGRIDVFSRVYLFVYGLFNDVEDSEIYALSKKTAIAEQTNPSSQFDIFKCIGGGVDVDELDIEPVKDAESLEDKNPAFAPEL